MFWRFGIHEGWHIMKVMYFGFEGFDNSNGNNHLILKMLDDFLKRGLEVFYLSSHTTGDHSDIPPILENRKNFSYKIINRKTVNKKNFLSRYLNGIHYAFKAMKYWKKEGKSIDVIILQSRPTVVFSAILIKLFLKKPIIFNYFDIFPNGPYSYGAINNHLLFKILIFLQHILYKCCSKILVISEDTKETLLNEGVQINKMEIIRNWYNEEQIKTVPLEKNRFLSKYHIDTNKFIIQYAGNFGFTFNYKIVLEIAEKLKNNDNIEFHMIGTGTFEEDFRTEAKIKGLNNIRFFPWQDLDIISDVYSYCDLELVPLSKGVIWTSYPSKCSLLMACKKPFYCILEKESFFYNLIKEKEIGFCSSMDEIDEAINNILNLAKNKDCLEKVAENAFNYGSSIFSSKFNLDKLWRIIIELGDKKNESI